MARKGLGKGLDSLIPEIYDENFDSNSPQSLEDLLNDVEENAPQEEEKSGEEKKNIFEEIEEEENVEKDNDSDSIDEDVDQRGEDEANREAGADSDQSEVLSGSQGVEESQQDSQKLQGINPAHVEEVKEIVDKNPRITLWSARSSAVFRYLRKTEPEFSISKEASTLIDEAVSKKYPEIWALFDDY